MKTELNLNSPYKVYIDDSDLVYSFTTVNNVFYQLAFSDSNHLFTGISGEAKINNIYSLSIENIGDSFTPLDIKVKETVQEILKEFFKNKENCITYVCDNSDSQELARYRKFNFWFEDSDFSSNLIKLKNELKVDDETTYYTSLIYHKNNSTYDILKLSYMELIENLKDK